MGRERAARTRTSTALRRIAVLSGERRAIIIRSARRDVCARSMPPAPFLWRGTGGTRTHEALLGEPHAPCVRRGLREPPRDPQRRAMDHTALSTVSACYLRPIFWRFWPEQARSTRATCYSWESKSRVRGWGWHGPARNRILTRKPPRRAALAQIEGNAPMTPTIARCD